MCVRLRVQMDADLHAKIADFGISKTLTSSVTQSALGARNT